MQYIICHMDAYLAGGAGGGGVCGLDSTGFGITLPFM
jgi:hypothetical protein